MNNIEELKLDRCELTERTIDALIDAKHIRNLRHISLWKNHGIGDAAARLFNSHHMRSLREIYLNTVQLSGEALARELGQLDFDAPLETLGVQSNAIGDEGALALAGKIINLIADGKIDTDIWITDRLAFDDVPTEFAAFTDTSRGTVKAIIEIT